MAPITDQAKHYASHAATRIEAIRFGATPDHGQSMILTRWPRRYNNVYNGIYATARWHSLCSGIRYRCQAIFCPTRLPLRLRSDKETARLAGALLTSSRLLCYNVLCMFTSLCQNDPHNRVETGMPSGHAEAIGARGRDRSGKMGNACLYRRHFSRRKQLVRW